MLGRLPPLSHMPPYAAKGRRYRQADLHCDGDRCLLNEC